MYNLIEVTNNSEEDIKKSNTNKEILESNLKNIVCEFVRKPFPLVTIILVRIF